MVYDRRELANNLGPYTLVAFSAATLTNSTFVRSVDSPRAFTFASGTPPTSTPQLESNKVYWGIAPVVAGATFSVYLTQEDARAAENAVLFTNFGTAVNITVYDLQTYLLIEQLSLILMWTVRGISDSFAAVLPQHCNSRNSINGQDILSRVMGLDLKHSQK